MNGKGSKRRPQSVTDDVVGENWERTFGGKKMAKVVITIKDASDDPANDSVLMSWECSPPPSKGVCPAHVAATEAILAVRAYETVDKMDEVKGSDAEAARHKALEGVFG